jgi:hypothetical protein
MSWWFRLLVLPVTLAWGLVPQIVCFMPDQPLTQREMDCCEKIENNCGQMDMSCCRTTVRTDVLGVMAKAVRNAVPHGDIAAKPVGIASILPTTTFTYVAVRNDHAPPRDVGGSSLILRI